MDWSFVPGVDLTRSPVVTEVEGGRMLTWPGCRAFQPSEALGSAEASSAMPNAAEGFYGAPQDPIEALLDRLWPQIERCTTCRELGAVILAAGVDPKLKHALGRVARDRLGATWSDWTVRDCLKPARHSEERSDANREGSRVFRAANPKYQNDYEKARRKTDPSYALSERVRNRIAHALRAARAGKSGKSLDLLGCTPADFKEHLESLWTEGMDWSTYGNFPGGWVVDHVVPVASFDLTTEEGQRAAFHYQNCQPMWFEENATKSSHHDGRRWTHSHHLK